MDPNTRVHVSIPVYYTQSFARKPDKTILIGLNALRTMHHYAQNKMKQDMSAIIKQQLLKEDIEPIKGTYEVAYVYYYKNKSSDLLNCGALSSKYFLDCLQQTGIVQEDNVQYCVKEAFYVGEQDKESPRMECFVRPYAIKSTLEEA